MKRLDIYIAKIVWLSIFLVMLVLIGLQIFILFIGELSDLGRGQYGILQACLYIFIMLPAQIYLFFPVACMFGALIGLGILAEARELVIMRASGCSIARIAASVFMAALPLVFIMTMLGESVIPKLSSWGHDLKLQYTTGEKPLRTREGIWFYKDNEFMRIGRVLPDLTLKNVIELRWDEKTDLSLFRQSEEIILDKNQWIAKNVSETHFESNATKTEHTPEKKWDVSLYPAFPNLYRTEPQEMSFYELWQFLHVDGNDAQSTKLFRLFFWQHLFEPVTTFIMIFVAIPFIFGPLRSSSMGSKLLTGAALGFIFHITSRFFIPFSQVLDWPPWLMALTPGFLFMLIGMYFIRRMK